MCVCVCVCLCVGVCVCVWVSLWVSEGVFGRLCVVCHTIKNVTHFSKMIRMLPELKLITHVLQFNSIFSFETCNFLKLIVTQPIVPLPILSIRHPHITPRTKTSPFKTQGQVKAFIIQKLPPKPSKING